MDVESKPVDKTPLGEAISVVIPVFNEEANIHPLLDQLLPVLNTLNRPFEILFINDGSEDDSGLRLDEEAKTHTSVKVIHLARNFGQTAAMMAGVDQATGEIIITLDADLQNDSRDIPALLQRLDEGFDLVSGWRRHRQDAAIRRNLLSRVANFIISKVSGIHLHDYGCTLKAYRADLFKQVKLYGEMHRFIPIYVNWAGGKVTEMEVRHHPRTQGKSNYGMERILKVIMDLIVVYFMASYANKPIYFFGSLGLGSIFLSFLTGSYAIYRKVVLGHSFIETPLPLLTTLLLIMGAMFILMGIIADLLMRTYHESQNKPVYLIRRSVNLTEKK